MELFRGCACMACLLLCLYYWSSFTLTHYALNTLPYSHHFPWFCWNRCLSFYMPYYQSYSWSGLPVTLLENVPSRTTSCAPSRGNHLTILLLILSMENINWSRYKTNLRSPKGGQKKIVVTIKYILIRYFYNSLFTHHYNLVNL